MPKPATGPAETQPPASRPALYVGCAGWSIPRLEASRFPELGSQLQRYAQVFNAVEINSSFYRNHLPKTYRRWAESVPTAFRFSVKLPRSISHENRLRDCDALLTPFLAGVEELGHRLGCLLLQLPPRLGWDRRLVLAFLDRLRRAYAGHVVCEPRHPSWFCAEVDRELAHRGVARVAADPAMSARASLPAGDRQLQYVRLHGTPRMYYDSYPDSFLHRLAKRLTTSSSVTTQRWCIFDNTAAGHATTNALTVLHDLAVPAEKPRA